MATGSGEMTTPAKHRSTPWRARRAAATGWFWWTQVGFLSDGWPNWPLTTAPSSTSPGSITRGWSPAKDFAVDEDVLERALGLEVGEGRHPGQARRPRPGRGAPPPRRAPRRGRPRPGGRPGAAPPGAGRRRRPPTRPRRPGSNSTTRFTVWRRGATGRPPGPTCRRWPPGPGAGSRPRPPPRPAARGSSPWPDGAVVGRADEAGEDPAATGAFGAGLHRVEHLHDPGRVARGRHRERHRGEGGGVEAGLGARPGPR